MPFQYQNSGGFSFGKTQEHSYSDVIEVLEVLEVLGVLKNATNDELIHSCATFLNG